MTDLYADLGATRDATPEELKAAHRKAAKQSHPDKPGGSAEKFERVQSAWMVLSNPEKRSRYDATGDVEADSLNNELADIAGIVVQAFDAVIEHVAGDFAHNDIIDLMHEFLEERLDQGDDANQKIEAKRLEMAAMLERISCEGQTDLLSRELTNRIASAERQIAGNKAIQELHRKASDHIDVYGWKVDPKPEPDAAATFEEMLRAYQRQPIPIDGMTFRNMMGNSI